MEMTNTSDESTCSSQPQGELAVVYRPKLYLCYLCGARFYSKVRYDEHIIVHEAVLFCYQIYDYEKNGFPKSCQQNSPVVPTRGADTGRGAFRRQSVGAPDNPQSASVDSAAFRSRSAAPASAASAKRKRSHKRSSAVVSARRSGGRRVALDKQPLGSSDTPLSASVDRAAFRNRSATSAKRKRSHGSTSSRFGSKAVKSSRTESVAPSALSAHLTKDHVADSASIECKDIIAGEDLAEPPVEAAREKQDSVKKKTYKKLTVMRGARPELQSDILSEVQNCVSCPYTATDGCALIEHAIVSHNAKLGHVLRSDLKEEGWTEFKDAFMKKYLKKPKCRFCTRTFAEMTYRKLHAFVCHKTRLAGWARRRMFKVRVWFAPATNRGISQWVRFVANGADYW